jgi:hypothetical protein
VTIRCGTCTFLMKTLSAQQVVKICKVELKSIK